MQEKEATGVVTRKGQVTIPVHIRRVLGIKPNDRVAFREEDGKVYLAPVKETLESTFGAVAPLRRPEDWQARRDEAIEDHVAQTLREMASSREDDPET